jgi:hypothetical protein
MRVRRRRRRGGEIENGEETKKEEMAKENERLEGRKGRGEEEKRNGEPIL